MKYIRTNEFVYETEKVIDWIEKNKDKLQPIKEADTIEELCDEFVVITHEYRKIGSLYDCEYHIDIFKRKVKSNNPIIAIYGAIWTDKGLQFVAKMNESGTFELL